MHLQWGKNISTLRQLTALSITYLVSICLQFDHLYMQCLVQYLGSHSSKHPLPIFNMVFINYFHTCSLIISRRLSSVFSTLIFPFCAHSSTPPVLKLHQLKPEFDKQHFGNTICFHWILEQFCLISSVHIEGFNHLFSKFSLLLL